MSERSQRSPVPSLKRKVSEHSKNGAETPQPQHSFSADILHLQRTIGNTAVKRMLQIQSNLPKSVQRTYEHSQACIDLTKADFEALRDAVDQYAEYAVSSDFSGNEQLNERQIQDLIAINEKLGNVGAIFNRLGQGRHPKWVLQWKFVIGTAKVTSTRERTGNFLETLEQAQKGKTCHNELGKVLQACLATFEDLKDE